jgi:hypothetical protein
MRNKNLLAVAMALFMAGTGNNARAADFDGMQVAALSPQELDSLRGGFLMAGGMTIDFSIIRQNSINGQLQQQLSFDSKNLALNKIQSDNLRNLLQLGSSNPAILKQMPNLTTIIRNSADNALIQNLNTLDVTVKNTEAARSAIALAPLRDLYLLR